MTEKGRIVKMVSQDQEEFEVEYGVATMSTLISNVLQDVSEETTTVPIPNVNAQVLAKVSSCAFSGNVSCRMSKA